MYQPLQLITRIKMKMYADHLTPEEWQNLFGNSDDEDFAGFE